MRGGLTYLAAALCLARIAVWGSENLFWTIPSAEIGAIDLLLTWALYALCLPAALSVAIWARLGGWRGAFLGGLPVNIPIALVTGLVRPGPWVWLVVAAARVQTPARSG